MNIKINNVNISIENGNTIIDPDFNEIDSMSKSIESSAIDVNNQYIAYRLISNVKAVESFGYKSTESVGEKIKNAANKIARTIVEFFKRVLRFFQKIEPIISTKIIKNKLKSPKAKELLGDSLTELTGIANDFAKFINPATKEINKIISQLNKGNADISEVKKQQEVYKKVIKATSTFASATNALFSNNNDHISDAMQKVRDVPIYEDTVSGEVQKVYNAWNSFKRSYNGKFAVRAQLRNKNESK